MSSRLASADTLTRRRYSTGVNLIEIMVAMTIGLFLVLGATTLYVRTKKTSDVDDSIARLQESARYALSIIETDVRMANYWGLSKDAVDFQNSATNEASDDGDALTQDDDDIGKALEGSSAEDCGDTTAFDVERYVEATNSDYALDCDANSEALETSDTLTVRRALRAIAALDTDKIQICSARSGEVKMITAGMPCAGEIHDLSTNIYYIDKDSDQAAGYPSLRRKTLGTGPEFSDQEVIPGVEDMQIQLGWAPPNAAGYPTSSAVMYLQPGNAALAQAGSQVVAVRVWLLIRAETPDNTFTDTRSYSYGSRTTTPTTNSLSTVADVNKQYAPNDNFRRLLVSRTFFIRNVVGT